MSKTVTLTLTRKDVKKLINYLHHYMTPAQSGLDQLIIDELRAQVNAPTYKIIRFYRDERPSETLVRGLTLAQAQEHCSRPDTQGVDWFDGFETEES